MADYFTADLHFGHGLMLDPEKGCDRPFSSVEEMDEVLIDNWNSCVKRGDRVFFLGDFSFYKIDKAQKIFNRLNGQKFIILGNHDKENSKNRISKNLPTGWAWMGDRYNYRNKNDGWYIVLDHHRVLPWFKKRYGAGHLFGHYHGNIPPVGRSFDIGVDCWDYKPVHYDQIIEIFSKIDVDKSVDTGYRFKGSDLI